LSASRTSIRHAWSSSTRVSRCRRHRFEPNGERLDQHGATPRAGAAWPAPADGRAARTSEDHNIRGRADHARHDRALGSRWSDQPPSPLSLGPMALQRLHLRDIPRPGARPRTPPGRGGHHGQSLKPQGAEGARDDQSRRCEPGVPPALQPRTSTRSRTPSPSSRRCSAKRRSAPSPVSGKPSAASSRRSPLTNAPTTSPQPDTRQTDRIPL
jgi:hypothetical protein